jgi:hypothetical protein
MDEPSLFPFGADAAWLLRYCRLPLHKGSGSVAGQDDLDHPTVRMVRKMRQSMGQAEPELAQRQFDAGFFLPVSGDCKVCLRCPSETGLSRNFGEGLTVTGDSSDGPFCLTCPRYYIDTVSESGEQPGWAIASPINQPATVTYGEPRPVATITAIINNFDFDFGNVCHTGDHGRSDTLRLEAAGSTVDFVWRRGRDQLRRLVDAGLASTASFVTFSFAAWAGASDAELTAFANNVSTLCCYVAGQHTGKPGADYILAEALIELKSLDDEGLLRCLFHRRSSCEPSEIETARFGSAVSLYDS